MSKIVDELILIFSLKILSGSSLHFVGIRVFIVGYVRNVKSNFSTKKGVLATHSRLATGMSREIKLRNNWLVRLSFFVLWCSSYCDPLASCMLHTCGILASHQSRVTREIQSWEPLWMLTHLNSSHSFTHNSYMIPT